MTTPSTSLSRHPRRGLRDWTDLMVKDHGFLRLGWHNLYQIDDDMWRCNQPTPARIHAFARRGIKTIINLRGPRDDGGWRLEAEACAQTHIDLVDFTARSRAAPDKQMLYDTKSLFEGIAYPAVMHCKSGADRAGLMSALYLLIHKNTTAEHALKQLSFRYLHVKAAKTGMLDAFIEAYIPYQKQGMTFFDWVDTVYDPVALQNGFMARGWANRLVDDFLKRE